LQEALIAIHTHRHTYDQTQPFTPSVYTIARCKFLDYLRRTKYSLKERTRDGWRYQLKRAIYDTSRVQTLLVTPV
jgi:DNA-directed RNA polymerase specialized sigma24 family protein